MAAFKDKNGTWFTSFRYTDWTGKRRRVHKRGFERKKDAAEFERENLAERSGAVIRV